MAEVGHALTRDSGNRSSSSSSYGISGAAEILGSALTGSAEYFLLAIVGVGGSSTGNNGNEHIIADDSGQIALSHSRIEPRRSNSANSHSYMWFHKYTAPASPGDVEVRYRNSASGTVRTGDANLIAINLDDLAAGDWAYDEDTTSHTTLDNSAWTDGASVTIGNGSDDYAVFYHAHVIVDTTSSAIRMRLVIDGTPLDYIDLEGEDSVEEYCIGGIAYVAAPGASITAKVQIQTDSGSSGVMDVDSNKIFALRLNAFEDYAGIHETTNTFITAADVNTEVANIGATTNTAASRDWAVCGFALNDVDDSAKRTERHLEDSSLGTAAGGTSDDFVQNGVTDQTPLPLFGEFTSVADATTFNLDFDCTEENDVSPQPEIIDAHIIAFTWEIAAAASNISNLATGTITLTDNVPDAVTTEHHIANLATGTITLTANVPTATASDFQQSDLPTTTITLTANAPQAITTELNVSDLATATITLTANVPSAVTTEHRTSELATATITLTANAPDAVTTEHRTSDLATATISLTTNAPQAVVTEHNVSDLATATITLTANAPEITSTAGENVALETTTITLTTNAPTAVTTEHHIADLPSATITLTANAPQAVSTSGENVNLGTATITLTANAPTIVTTELEPAMPVGGSSDPGVDRLAAMARRDKLRMEDEELLTVIAATVERIYELAD